MIYHLQDFDLFHVAGKVLLLKYFFYSPNSATFDVLTRIDNTILSSPDGHVRHLISFLEFLVAV